MHSFVKSSFLVVMAAASLAHIPYKSANAEVFFLEDKDDRFTVTFPDTWDRISNQKPDDQLTIAAQGTYEFAVCRMRVREEGRYKIYPDTLANSVQRIAINRDFWENYLGEYNDVEILSYKDDAGLGDGYASMVEASFETAEGAIVRKSGIMFASLYHGKVYILECSAENTVYSEWRPAFLGIVKSVDFTTVVHPDAHGNYRDFMGQDIPVEVVGPEELDEYKL